MMNLFDMGKPKLKFSKSKDKVRWFSTFSGIGMQEMALKRVTSNYEILGFSEIDKHAIKSYKAIHGDDLINYGDIRDIRGGDLPKNIDFFTYSFPCTDVSKAGQQKGLTSETRSGLVFEVLRLLDDLNNHVSYTGTNIIEWTKNHNDWVKINNHVDKLFAQGEKLRVERDKLNE